MIRLWFEPHMTLWCLVNTCCSLMQSISSLVVSAHFVVVGLFVKFQCLFVRPLDEISKHILLGSHCLPDSQLHYSPC